MKRIINEFKTQNDLTVVNNDLSYIFVYQNDSFNIQLFNQDYLEIINKHDGENLSEVFVGVCKGIDDQSKENLLYLLFSGMMIIYDKKRKRFFMLDLISKPSRPTSDSISEPESITGSRDGFVENIKINLTLIRGRVKDLNLKQDEYLIGKRSKTRVTLLSIEDITNDEYLNMCKEKIKNLDIDALLTMDDLTVVFQENKLMPQTLYIGNPDLACRNLYNGQVVILIENIPNAICVPNTIGSFINHRVEKTNLKIYSYVERIMQFMFIFLSVFFLSLLACFVTYQSDSLSLLVLSTLKVTQRGVFLPIFIEILLVLFLFEMYYIVSLKSPKLTLSSMVVLVGGIIIGQNTISSGMVGVFIITMVALTFLSTFTISSNVPFIMSISFIRALLLLSSTILGLFGFTLASLYLVVRIADESNMNEDYLYPFIPFSIKGIKKLFLFDSSKRLVTRPDNLKVKNRRLKK